MRRPWRILFLFVAACAAGQGQCGGCPASSYQYPRTESGKEPIANAASIRLNAGALEFAQAQLPALLPSMCCDYDALPETERKETPAESCWSSAKSCFVESTTGKKLLHFYIGTANTPVKVNDIAIVGDLELRNGDHFTRRAIEDQSDEEEDRPLCNDLGGETYDHMVGDPVAFCRTPGSSGCNSPSTDWCCGGGGYVGWPTQPHALNFCYSSGGQFTRRVVPRLNGYPSNLYVPLDTLADKEHIAFEMIDADATHPAGIAVKLKNIPFSADLNVMLPDILGGSIACFVRDEGTTPTLLAQEINFTIRPRFVRNAVNLPMVIDICPTCFEMGSFTFDINDADITPDRRDPECNDNNWFLGWQSPAFECVAECGAASALASALTFVFDVIKPLVAEPIANAVTTAIAGRLNGLAVETQTRVDPKGLLGDALSLRFGRPLGLFLGPNGNGLEVNGVGDARGLSVSADIGAEGEYEPCVPDLPLPPAISAAAPELPGTVMVDGAAQSYHLSAAVNVHVVQRALAAAFRSGLLCLGIGTADIFALTGGEQRITAGLLFFLVPDLQRIISADAPVFFSLEPRGMPEVTLGAVGEPLLKMRIPKLGLSFYASSRGRLVRVFGLETELLLDASTVRGPHNALKLVIERLELGNITPTFSELVEHDFSKVLTPLFDILTGSVLKDRLSFALDFDKTLSDALKIPIGLRINTVQRASDTHFALYLTLCNDAEMHDITNTVCCDPDKTDDMCGAGAARDVAAAFAPSAYPLYEPAVLPGIRATTRPTGAVALDTAGIPVVVAVDGGAFVRPKDGILSSPRLAIPGRHTLLVQPLALAAGSTDFAGPAAAIDLEIDSERPAVHIVDDGSGALHLEGEDLVTPLEELILEWRASSDAAWTRSPSVTATHGTLEARAIDRAGNVSELVRYALPGTAPAPEGCASSSQPSLALLLAVALLRLRRRVPHT